MRDDKDRNLVKLAHAALNPKVAWESPMDRACLSAFNAVDDLNLAIHTAKTPEELASVRDVVEDIIARLGGQFFGRAHARGILGPAMRLDDGFIAVMFGIALALIVIRVALMLRWL